MVQKLEMGYCPLSMRLGAGQAWAQAGRAAGADTALGGRRARLGVRCAQGVRVRSGRVGGRELGAERAAGERQRRWGGRRWGVRALAGARQGERARGWAHGARGARPAGSTGAQLVRASWASWARLGFCAL